MKQQRTGLKGGEFMRRNMYEENLISFLQAILAVEGEISLSDFKKSASKAFSLTAHDLSFSKTRPNERMYEQRCRNSLIATRIFQSI